MEFHVFSLQIQKCIQLDSKLHEMDREISVNPQFVKKVRVSSALISFAWRQLELLHVLVLQSSGMHDDDVPGSSMVKAPGGYAM